MSLVKNICDTASGLYSLLVGLAITGKNFASPQLTIHYPRQEVTNLDTYRGHIELVPLEDNPILSCCVGCGMCAKSCPSGCITVESKELPKPPAIEPLASAEPGAKPAKAKRTVGSFILNYSLCSLCGQCVRSCPSDGLRFSTNVYFAARTRAEMTIDLVERFNRQAAGKKGA